MCTYVYIYQCDSADLGTAIFDAAPQPHPRRSPFLSASLRVQTIRLHTEGAMHSRTCGQRLRLRASRVRLDTPSGHAERLGTWLLVASKPTACVTCKQVQARRAALVCSHETDASAPRPPPAIASPHTRSVSHQREQHQHLLGEDTRKTGSATLAKRPCCSGVMLCH